MAAVSLAVAAIPRLLRVGGPDYDFDEGVLLAIPRGSPPGPSAVRRGLQLPAPALPGRAGAPLSAPRWRHRRGAAAGGRALPAGHGGGVLHRAVVGRTLGGRPGGAAAGRRSALPSAVRRGRVRPAVRSLGGWSQWHWRPRAGTVTATGAGGCWRARRWGWGYRPSYSPSRSSPRLHCWRSPGRRGPRRGDWPWPAGGDHGRRHRPAALRRRPRPGLPRSDRPASRHPGGGATDNRPEVVGVAPRRGSAR